MKRLSLTLVTFCCVVVLTGLAAAQQVITPRSFTYVSIDVPCSACPGGSARKTVANGINAGGEIVGTYNDATGSQHGFLLSRGQYTTIDVPGSLRGVSGSLPTNARGINAAGEIVGSYVAPADGSKECPTSTSAACIKGFLFSHGKFSSVLVAGHPGSIPQRIGPDGSINGCLHDYDLMASMFGFQRTHFGDMTLMENGGELAQASDMVPSSMNNGATPDRGTIVGLYMEMTTNRRRGYIVQNGIFTPYDPPDSIFTRIWDINPAGNMVGEFHDSAGKTHGFLQVAGEPSAVTIDYPEAVATAAFGINPSGAIVGQYTDISGKTHGFLAAPTTTN
jgi:probable HAF family extracellular repeat protein